MTTIPKEQETGVSVTRFWKQGSVNYGAVSSLRASTRCLSNEGSKTFAQLCMVHMLHHGLNYVSWKMRKAVAANVRCVYAAANVDEGEIQLQELDEKWGADSATLVKSWRMNWPLITPFFEHPTEIRRLIYTTNATESVDMSLLKITKDRGLFPRHDAARGQATTPGIARGSICRLFCYPREHALHADRDCAVGLHRGPELERSYMGQPCLLDSCRAEQGQDPAEETGVCRLP
jgi:hypothetical protein